MTNVVFLLTFVSALFLFSPEALADSEIDLYVLNDGTALYSKPDSNSSVVQRAWKGWILHAKTSVTGPDNVKWYRVWEIDSDVDAEISYWYVHRAYGVDAVYVRAKDVRADSAEQDTGKDDNLIFLPKNNDSGTNTLGKTGISSIVSCLQNVPANRQWLNDFFFYSDAIDCFDLAGPGKTHFFDTLSLERTIGLALEVRPKSTIEGANSLGQTYYNPMVARWIIENFTGLKANSPELFALAQTAYDKQRYIARSFVYAYVYLTLYDNFDKQVQAYKEAANRDENMLEWLERFTPNPKQNYDIYFHDFDGDGWIGYRDGYNRFRYAVGFWLRRGIDGSAHAFKTLMTDLMKEYDGAWFAQAIPAK